MRKLLLILPGLLLTLLSASCTDENINNIYLTLTQAHRADQNDDPLLQDTNIVFVQVLNIKDGKFQPKAKVKLTMPDGIIQQKTTDKSGYAKFKWSRIKEGYYFIQASLKKKKIEYTGSKNVFIYKKSNPVIIIYIKEPKLLK